MRVPRPRSCEAPRPPEPGLGRFVAPIRPAGPPGSPPRIRRRIPQEARMQTHAITLLGTGLIGDFYTMTLHGQRGRDRVRVAYSRSDERATAFASRWGIPETTTDVEAAIRHPETD